MFEKIRSKITVNATKKPTFVYALFVAILVLSFVIIPVVVFKLRVQVMFLLGWVLAIPLCMLLGYTYHELQKGMIAFAARVILPVTFFLCIGAMSGAWNASGTIAFVTRLGLSFINPGYYFLTAFLLGVCFALMTGTSWGTLSTVGVAIVSVGILMGMDPISAAAPVICAAYIGDCFSPISDTPTIISGAVGLDLFKFIKYQCRISIPVIILTCIYFFFKGKGFSNVAIDTAAISQMIADIEGNFKVGFIAFTPILVVMLMLLLKSPTIPALLGGIVSGICVAVVYQEISLNVVITSMFSGFKMDSGSAFIDKIFSRGGMTSMSGTIFLMTLAFCLFGILDTAGIMESIIEPMTKKIKSNVGAVAATLGLGTIGNFSGAAFSCVLCGNVMSKFYEEKNISKYELGNAIVVGGMWFSLLIPWSANCVATAGFLQLDDIFKMMSSIVTIPIYVVVLFISAFLYDKKHKHEYNN